MDCALCMENLKDEFLIDCALYIAFNRYIAFTLIESLRRVINSNATSINDR